MKAFRFPLQPLRVLRERKEQAAQKKYVEALRAVEVAAGELHLASEELAAGWALLCKEMHNGATAVNLVRTRSWCNVLESRQKECAQQLQVAQHALDATMRELMLAKRDREALENYHDKCRRAYDRAAQREEQKRLDELALRSFNMLDPLRFPN
jgi:flagellar export protein FliJ